LVFFAIGLASALSLLPYTPLMARTRDWNILLHLPGDLSEIGLAFAESVDSSGSFLVWIWVALFAAALTACAYRAWAPAAPEGEHERERAAFLGAAGFVGAVGYGVFLRSLGYVPRTWYCVPAIVFLAAALDTALDPSLRRSRSLRILRLVAALVLTAVTSLRAWPALQVRQTRIDRAATRLQELASKDDLIVVDSWEYGISFMRYYQGSTPWTTLPSLSDHWTHRYDLIKQAMLEPAAIDPVLKAVGSTLRSRHRVWLVGRTPFPPPTEVGPQLPPPPLRESGWHAAPYMMQWSDQLSRFLQRHAIMVRGLPLLPDESVNLHEDLRVLVFAGWND
jgi:hypothetical protein